jgi:hypothetical protein
VCVIVDNNLAARVLVQSDPEFEPVRERLFQKDKPPIRLAYGGKLRDELFGNKEVRRALRILDSAGRLKLVPDQKIEQELRSVLESGLCKSNDPHVIALARAAQARVLVSDDRDLFQDFKNPRLLSNPRGKVYQRRQHAKLLNMPCDMS